MGKKVLTIEDVKNCIPFKGTDRYPKDVAVWRSVYEGLINTWYELEKIDGATDEEAAKNVLDKLLKIEKK